MRVLVYMRISSYVVLVRAVPSLAADIAYLYTRLCQRPSRGNSCVTCCRPAGDVASPFTSMPSAATGSCTREQSACILCLGRMAVLAAQSKEVVGAVAPVVTNMLSLVRPE